MIFMAGLCKKDCAHPFYRCEQCVSVCVGVALARWSVCVCVSAGVHEFMGCALGRSFMLSNSELESVRKVHMNSVLALYF